MSSECPTVWTHTLSVHGAVLPGHDHSRAHPWFASRFGRFIRMACAWRSYYFRQQDHLVGYRAGVGKILVDHLLMGSTERDRAGPIAQYVRWRFPTPKSKFRATPSSTASNAIGME